MSKTKYYIAYGSNLHVAQMQRRCPGAIAVGTAWLDGWRLAFRGSKTGAYLTIIPDGEHETPVGIWKITAADERMLDIYEGYPTFYEKQTIRLRMKLLHPTERFSCKTVNAMVYLMPLTARPGTPSQLYVNTCAVGYKCFDLPERYLSEAVLHSHWETRPQIQRSKAG